MNEGHDPRNHIGALVDADLRDMEIGSVGFGVVTQFRLWHRWQGYLPKHRNGGYPVLLFDGSDNVSRLAAGRLFRWSFAHAERV